MENSDPLRELALIWADKANRALCNAPRESYLTACCPRVDLPPGPGRIQTARSRVPGGVVARPSLSPMTFSDFERPYDRSWKSLLRNLFRLPGWLIRSVFRGIGRIFTTDLAAGDMRKTLPMRTVLVGAIMKLAWLPPVVLLACGWAVYRESYGTSSASAATGQVARITSAYHERVYFGSKDGTRLSAVWVPAIRPQDVVTQGDELLKRRVPAVVLVHDHGNDSSQMLAQAALLHELGLHVLILETRGSGRSQRTARTFGQLERLDVAAAVDYVAGRPIVDSARIAVWGVGSGAEAAEAAPSTTPVSLLLAESRSLELGDPNVDTRFMPPHWAYNGLRPVCRWLFDVGVAGGAPPATGTKPGRVVQIGFGDMQRAMIEFDNFASQSLVLHKAN